MGAEQLAFQEIPNLETILFQGPCYFSGGDKVPIEIVSNFPLRVIGRLKQCCLHVWNTKMTLEKIIIAPFLPESYFSNQKNMWQSNIIQQDLNMEKYQPSHYNSLAG